LQQKEKNGLFKVILDQFKDIMIVVLLIAALLGVIFGIVKKTQGESDWYVELVEGLVIFAIVVINATIGSIQEIKASNALEALKKIGAPTSRVVRNGKTIIIPSNEIVLGDIVYIEDGSIVPADLRLIESSNLKIQEASLTGESVPVDKDANKSYNQTLPLGDRKNMCYSSSVVTYGNGVGIAVAIGMATEVGKIAKMLNDQEEQETPIKKKLNKIGKILSIIGAITAVVVLAVGFATYD
jgi:Ca2+-transporting ATPase